ncbi:MAG: hypothetical protein HFH67_08650 [Lachnospiraceae bacterium]|nr:hypothetical protein [Lachnospiraceae bacterium]
MAKQRQVNICVHKDNVSLNTLIKSLQEMHIEVLEEIVRNIELPESQIKDLLREMQKKGGHGRTGL